MFREAKAWQSYRHVAMQSASPGQIVLLLFDGVIRFLEQARQGFLKEDPKEFNEAINNNLQRAQAILNEMDASLDMQSGGEFAGRMRSLYVYFDRRLQESNMSKTEDGINEVLQHVGVLRNSWAEMLNQSRTEPPAA
jgi:flagellar protein FliS